MHNSRMQTLRNARLLGRLVILWLVLSLGVAVASPLLKPVSMDVVCSASGVAIVFHDDALRSSNPSGLHCPLCLPLSAPPPRGAAILASPNRALKCSECAGLCQAANFAG